MSQNAADICGERRENVSQRASKHTTFAMQIK